MSKKYILVVLGMHRSGTSFLTSVLKYYGFDTGDNLIPAAADNPDGFYEDKAIVELNIALEKIIDIDHLSHNAIFPTTTKINNYKSVKVLKLELKEYISKLVFESKGVIVLKDPRICRLLPVYKSVFNDLNIVPQYLVNFRNPSSCIRSKSSRDYLDPKQVEMVWLNSYMDIFLNLSYQNILSFVSYEDVISNPFENKNLDKLIYEMSELSNVPLSRSEKPILRNRPVNNDIEDYPVIPFTKKVYEALQSLSNSNKNFTSIQSTLINEYSLLINNSQAWRHKSKDDNIYLDQISELIRIKSRLELENKRLVDICSSLNKDKENLLNETHRLSDEVLNLNEIQDETNLKICQHTKDYEANIKINHLNHELKIASLEEALSKKS